MRFDNELRWNMATEAEIVEEPRGDQVKRHDAFAVHLADHGMSSAAGAGLQDLATATATATALRSGEDWSIVTDGPLIALQDHVGGFYLIESTTGRGRRSGTQLCDTREILRCSPDYRSRRPCHEARHSSPGTGPSVRPR